MEPKTQIYIAADWDGDKEAVDQLCSWNNENSWDLSFVDAHDVLQTHDGSLYCSIKAALRSQLYVSQTFVLIVGEETKSGMSGSCLFCGRNNSNQYCARGHLADYRSYIEYACDKAVADDLKIIVLYNSAAVSRDKCPEILQDKGTHVAMQLSADGLNRDEQPKWDYASVKAALER